MNNGVKLSTLSLSTANVSVLLGNNTMLVTGRLGSLNLVDDSEVYTIHQQFEQILSIEGNSFAEFSYQTFDPTDHETYTGIKSKVRLAAGSVKINFLEEPLHDIYLFLAKLAKLKGVYDAATQAAVQRAQEIERMQFDVSVKTPIVVFPSDSTLSSDRLTMRLGELSASNSFDGLSSTITAGLTGIQLTSDFKAADGASTLNIIDNIDIFAEIGQTTGIDRGVDFNRPDSQVSNSFSWQSFVADVVVIDRSLNIGRQAALDPDSIQSTHRAIPSYPACLAGCAPGRNSGQPIAVDQEPQCPILGFGQRSYKNLCRPTTGARRSFCQKRCQTMDDHGLGCHYWRSEATLVRRARDGTQLA